MTTAPDLPALHLPEAPPPPPRLAAVPTEPADDLDFDAFVRRYETRLRRLVMRRLGDAGDAEEIAQETLLRAYQHRASFAEEDELIAWSTVVAQRLVIDRVRVRGRAVAVAEVPESARVGRDTAEIVVARSEARTALESLEAIPERQAAILWAREVEGLHYDDIAERFGITEPAVRSLLHRGRRALRKEYARRGGTLPLAGLIPLAPWLVALRKLGKVRTAAKAAAPTGLTALAIAGVTAVGIGGGLFGGHGAGVPRTTALPPGTTFSSVHSTSATPRDPDLAGGGDRLVDRAPARTARPPRSVPVDIVKRVDRCVGAIDSEACVGPGRAEYGDQITIGPRLPENPTGARQIGYTSEYVAVCGTYHAAQAQAGGRASAVPVTCTERPKSTSKPDGVADAAAPVRGEFR